MRGLAGEACIRARRGARRWRTRAATRQTGGDFPRAHLALHRRRASLRIFPLVGDARDLPSATHSQEKQIILPGLRSPAEESRRKLPRTATATYAHQRGYPLGEERVVVPAGRFNATALYNGRGRWARAQRIPALVFTIPYLSFS
jgi:hypothetical protein